MKVLITGAAGFIGNALSVKLLKRGDVVIGLDNHNDYYDPKLKEARVRRLHASPTYVHERVDLTNLCALQEVFKKYVPDRVVNLAAQAGVKYSMENPIAYINSNIVGFTHILECCQKAGVEHLVYASSSSVYGANNVMPFSTHHSANHPLSLYAATKKSNELIAHSYSHLYKLPTTGLRFFTVYGPWGRPDMALFKFTSAILNDQKVQLFNNGNHMRDFTYVDDIVEAVIRILDHPAIPSVLWSGLTPDPATSLAPWRIYNIGNSRPIALRDYVKAIERSLGKEACLEFLPLQPGDVPDTFADVSDLVEEFNYKPSTNIEDGIGKFVSWYRSYYQV